ncbi:MAG: hypothetical protein O7F08_11570, partial [Deltaproteobacteria bacterium]|nr:hypothetical protein [Deltaproteobacteria bacterium]
MRPYRVISIAKFELLSVVKRWSYLITTFGLPLFLALISGTVFGAQTYFLTQRASESSAFGLIDEADVVDESVFEDGDGARVWKVNAIEVELYDSLDAAKDDLEAGHIRALYVVEPDYLETGKVRAVQSEKTPLLSMRGATVEPVLRSLLRRSLMADRLSEDIQERVLAPAYFVRTRIAPGG